MVTFTTSIPSSSRTIRSSEPTNRNLAERLCNRLKEWRAVATRYEKTARSFMDVLCLAVAFG